MTIEEFSKKAAQGGWTHDSEKHFMLTPEGIEEVTEIHDFELVLEPLAWRAVGKVEGWSDYTDDDAIEFMDYKKHMHRMIDALIEGKTIEQYLETL